jgi:outer membrane biogenesis lipoprotein LolB
MSRPMRVVLLLTCLLVTGCTATSTYQANIDDANCQAAGAKFGSKDYYQCRDKLQAARQ